MRILTASLLSLALTACQVNVQTPPSPSPKPTAAPTATPSPSPTATPSSGLNSEISLKYRQPVQIPAEKLQISFQDLVQDSRCPSDVQCIRAGDVTVRLTLIQNGSTLGQPELSIGEGDDKATALVGDYRVTLLRVRPESKLSTQTVPASDYELTVRVSKA